MRQLFALTFTAAAEIAGHRLVALDDTGKAATAASAAARIVGVSDSVGAASGGRVDVHLIGEVPAVAGAAILPGAPVTADAQGRAVPATTGRAVGFATTGAGAAGDLVQLFLSPHVVAP